MMKSLTVEEQKGFVQMAEGMVEDYESVEKTERHPEGLLVFGKDGAYRVALTFSERIVCIIKRMSSGTETSQTLTLPSDEEFFDAWREFFLEDALLEEELDGYYWNRIEEEAGLEQEMNDHFNL